MANSKSTPEIRTARPGIGDAGGYVQGALLPLVPVQGVLFVLENPLHLYPGRQPTPTLPSPTEKNRNPFSPQGELLP